jgi:outer membrane protein assembly factor BamB
VANGVVYAGGEQSFLYAMDASNGQVLNKLGKALTGGISSAAVVNGMVYVGGPKQKMYAYSLGK